MNLLTITVTANMKYEECIIIETNENKIINSINFNFTQYTYWHLYKTVFQVKQVELKHKQVMQYIIILCSQVSTNLPPSCINLENDILEIWNF